MKRHPAKLVVALLLILSACGGPPTGARAPQPAPPGAESAAATIFDGPSREELPLASAADGDRQLGSAASAIAALQRGDFEVAGERAEALIASEPDHAYGHLVAGLVRYRQAMHQLNTDVRTVLIAGLEAGGFNHRYMRSSLEQTSEALAAVDDSLAVASAQPTIALELCLACWEVDWNRNRRIDRADRLLFQIEVDAEGREIDEGDPRRKPTFRFDHGDVSWARAFTAFQRALIELILAYDWDAVDDIIRSIDDKPPKELLVRLKNPERVALARVLILDGLHHSAAARARYLAEDDDDREWMPNPRQKSHPLPLPVDAALYDTWGGVVGDLERLVRGEEGLSVTELAQLGDHQWKHPPAGYLDIGHLLAHPADIVIPVAQLERAFDHQRPEPALRSLLGEAYRPRMKQSPLPSRLSRMKSEMERGEESFERKLRYLFWIN